MTGKKLHQLMLELSGQQRKDLLLICESNADKRLPILRELLLQPMIDLSEMNLLISHAIDTLWGNSNSTEKQTKLRRIQHYFCGLIEQQLLQTLLQVNTSIRNVLLAKSLEKSGNMYLLNQYYDQAFKKSIAEEDTLFQLIGIKGKIRMKYMSHSEKELEEALALNTTFIGILNYANEQKIAEYYEHASNIYLEQNSIIQKSKQQYVEEIETQLAQLKSPLNKASLYVSMAKFHYNDPRLAGYFDQANTILNNFSEQTNEFLVIERKTRFLELRLKFFHGEDLNQLQRLTNEILQPGSVFSIMNNNTLFYKILFDLLLNELEQANQLLNQNHVYFKGEGKLLEHFLRALYYMKTGDLKKALQLLQPIMYGTNYFFAIFSRLMVLKIQLSRGQGAWSKSLVDATRRYLRLNSGNPLGQEANNYTLNQLNKKRLNKKNDSGEKAPVLTALHAFILEEL